MAKLVQLRLPDELLRRVDRFIEEGLYKSRSELIVDATRRFLDRSAPTSGLELFIDSYLTGTVKASKESSQSLEELFEKLRKDPRWRAQLGDTPGRLMRRLRSRAA